jgi:hypothetical protein
MGAIDQLFLASEEEVGHLPGEAVGGEEPPKGEWPASGVFTSEQLLDQCDLLRTGQ